MELLLRSSQGGWLADCGARGAGRDGAGFFAGAKGLLLPAQRQRRFEAEKRPLRNLTGVETTFSGGVEHAKMTD